MLSSERNPSIGTAFSNPVKPKIAQIFLTGIRYVVLLYHPPITMHPATHFTPPPCLYNDEHQETLRQEEKFDSV